MADDSIHQKSSVEPPGSAAFVQQKECYVYEVIVDGIVRYVGKGRGRRAARHIGIAEAVTRNTKHRYARSRFYKKLGAAIEAGKSVEIRYVATGLSSERAFQQEIELIASRGHDTLWNSTPGGEGVAAETARTIAIERWKEPGSRDRQRELLQKVWSDPKLLKNHSQKMSEVNRSPEAIEKQKRAAIIRWAKPSERERQAAHSRAMQALRSAKKHANLFSSVLSFGA